MKKHDKPTRREQSTKQTVSTEVMRGTSVTRRGENRKQTVSTEVTRTTSVDTVRKSTSHRGIGALTGSTMYPAGRAVPVRNECQIHDPITTDEQISDMLIELFEGVCLRKVLFLLWECECCVDDEAAS